MLHHAKRPRSARHGAAVVEFAITAPLLFMLVFAAIEFSRANMLLHTSAIAATNGARKGIIAGATAEDCRQAAFDELIPLGINEATVLVMPDVITDTTEMITVGVHVPINAANLYCTPRFFLGDSLIKVVSITREAKSGADAQAKADKNSKEAAKRLAAGEGASMKGSTPKPPKPPKGGDDDDDD